jgi:uncharacterized protein YbjT (DUF2867 family)
MRILVTGISGYVGSRLADRLLRDNHEVRGFSRREVTRDGLEIVRGDAISGSGLDGALADVEVAYYLIHSMEPSSDGPFGDRERAAAEHFAAAAQNAGVQRIVYLGGLLPEQGAASAHLASRLEVEEVLRDAVPGTLAFRASIVIGAQSRSFRFLVRLVERMPVLAIPAWHTHRTSPVDERDVIEMLARAATHPDVSGESLDVGGPDIVTYGELIDRIRDLMLVARPTVSFKRLTATPIASRVAAIIAGEQYELIGPLMDGLDGDLLPRDDRAAQILGVRLHALNAAIEHSLGEWERSEPLAAR